MKNEGVSVTISSKASEFWDTPPLKTCDSCAAPPPTDTKPWVVKDSARPKKWPGDGDRDRGLLGVWKQ